MFQMLGWVALVQSTWWFARLCRSWDSTHRHRQAVQPWPAPWHWGTGSSSRARTQLGDAAGGSAQGRTRAWSCCTNTVQHRGQWHVQTHQLSFIPARLSWHSTPTRSPQRKPSTAAPSQLAAGRRLHPGLTYGALTTAQTPPRSPALPTPSQQHQSGFPTHACGFPPTALLPLSNLAARCRAACGPRAQLPAPTQDGVGVPMR